MSLTSTLLDWFYGGLGGIGGWVIFAGGGLSAAVWLVADSTRRSLPVRFERAKVIFAQVLSIPAAVLHLTTSGAVAIQRVHATHEIVFYLGLLGGLTSAVVTGYYLVAYHDKVACRHGHPPYAMSLVRCPYCVMQAMATAHGGGQPTIQQDIPRIHVTEQEPHVAHAPAWLVTAPGQRYMLYQGENFLGRGREMEFQITGDQAVSRNHARIVEREGQFFVMDCGSTNGTRLNGRALAPFAEEPLRSGDVIALSDHTHVTFVLPEDETSPG